MRTLFSPPQIIQLKRRAKELRRADPELTQSAALDLVARENGWTHWALLAKNRLPGADDQIVLSCRPFPGGMSGVFLVDLTMVDVDLRGAFAKGPALSFDLPRRRGWLFRGAGPQSHKLKPYLDLSQGDLRGIFVEGSWRAILAVNGVQPREVQRRIDETLPELLRDLKGEAFTSLLPYIASTVPTAGGQFRLFFSKTGSNGVPEIGERTFATVDDAKATELPEGWVKIGIPLDKHSWLTHRLPFGWTQSVRDVRR